MRTPRLLTLLSVVFLLGACQSSVETGIEIRGDGGADVSVEVRFEGDIANVLLEDDSLRTSLEQTLRGRVGAVQVVQAGRAYILKPTIEELRGASDLTGVADVGVSVNDGAGQVAVVTVRPSGLEAAIAEAVKDEPDAAALVATMSANTFLEVSIDFPGEVRSTNGGVVQGSSVVYRDSVQNWAEGTLVAVGELERGGMSGKWWMLALLGAAAVALVRWSRR